MKRRTMISACLLVNTAFITSCGGGGGGVGVDNSSATQQPATITPTTDSYTISGVVSEPSGVALSGVQMGLSGASASSTISNVYGGFAFSGIANGTYVLTPSAAGMTFFPATRSVNIQGQSSSGFNFARSYASTQVIIDYMAALHSQSRTTFAANELTLSRVLAAQGGLMSGAHYSQSMSGYQTLVQSFTDASIAFTRAKSQTLAVDRAAVSAIMTGYASQDRTYADTYYRGVPWGLTGSSLTSVIGAVQTQITSIYTAALLQLP